MNQTAAAVGNAAASVTADSTDTITTVHLLLMAVFAILVVAGIVYGARLKHRRVAAEQRIEQDAADAGVPQPAPDRSPSLPVDRADAQPRAVATEDASSQGSDPAADVPASEPAIADEPIAAAAPMEASPAAEAASHPTPHDSIPGTPPGVAPAAAASPAQGPVTQLKGLGPKVAARLAELGITTVGQVAALTDDQADALDAQLGAFRGRMGRDRWIEQARFLAAGDRAGFEAVFGRL